MDLLVAMANKEQKAYIKISGFCKGFNGSMCLRIPQNNNVKYIIKKNERLQDYIEIYMRLN